MGKELLPALINVDPFDFTPKTKDEHLIFEERVWGLKQGEKFVFDPEHYGIRDFMSLETFPKEPIMSDTIIQYYSSGRREVVPTKDIKMFQVGKNLWSRRRFCYADNIHWATMEQMLTMFPNDKNLQMLNEKYPYLQYNGRFAINLDTEHYELAMPIEGQSCVAGNIFDIKEKLAYSDLGNLQKYFGGYARWLSTGVNKNDSKICEQLDEKMSKSPITVHFYKKGNCSVKTVCQMYAGYTDVPYSRAETMLMIAEKDIKPLREEYIKSGDPFNLTRGLKIFSVGTCNDYTKYNPQTGCPEGIFLVLPEVLCAWGQRFTLNEMTTICRDRFFYYWNPDMAENNKDYDKQKKLIYRKMTSQRTTNLITNIINLF